MTVGELLKKISSYELTEWKVVFSIRYAEAEARRNAGR